MWLSFFAFLAEVKVLANRAFVTNTNNWVCSTTITDESFMNNTLGMFLGRLVLWLNIWNLEVLFSEELSNLYSDLWNGLDDFVFYFCVEVVGSVAVELVVKLLTIFVWALALFLLGVSFGLECFIFL